MADPSRRHSTLGILWALYGILCIVMLAYVIVYHATLRLMFGALLVRVPNPYIWMSAFDFWVVGVIILFALSAFFSFLACATLLAASPSSRTWALIAAALALLGPPPGIALGAFTAAILYSSSSDFELAPLRKK
jgi:hypothetical protein